MSKWNASLTWTPTYLFMKDFWFYTRRFLICWVLIFAMYFVSPILFRDQNLQEMTSFARSFVSPEEVLLVQNGRWSEFIGMSTWASLKTAAAVWAGLALFGLLGKDDSEDL